MIRTENSTTSAHAASIALRWQSGFQRPLILIRTLLPVKQCDPMLLALADEYRSEIYVTLSPFYDMCYAIKTSK